MFNRKPEKTLLQKTLDDLMLAMSTEDEGSEKYAVMADQLVKLHALKVNETKQGVSYDTLATIAANLTGILIIVGYEQKNLLASKAVGFLKRV